MNKTITILHTSDIHGYILPINYANNNFDEIGLAKIATAIETYKKNDLILIDTGDTIHGSPMMYMHQKHLKNKPHPMAKAMNYLGYNYFIPGNHDFNYGKKYLKNFTVNLNAKTLCANITEKNNKLFFDKPYDIYTTTEGIKIAIIGLTTEYIPNWELPSHINELTFHSVINTLKKVLVEVKTYNPDSIIVAYHGGFEKDLNTFEPILKDTKENVASAIIEEFPEIDVLLTGHQHRNISQKSNSIILSQPGSKGESFSIIDLEFEKKELWILKSSKITLKTSSEYKAKQKVINLVSSEEKLTQKKLNQVIGQIQDGSMLIEDQFKARLDKHPIVTLINKIQLKKSQAIISAMSLANDSTGFNQNVTIRNVLSTYPFANTLSVVKISGKELKLALEENAKYFTFKNDQICISKEFSKPKLQHYNYDMFDGIEYTIKVSNEIGNRIVSLTRKGKIIKPDDSFTLVLNNYRATGGGDFVIFKKLEIIKEIPKDVSVLIIEYIQNKKVIKPETKQNIKVIK
ncbi:MAG: bifunctional metallophosphatase/5'-nucleotidase [Candidatus Izimaplasma sp.]|nr:bifunctional metallophosphatase/5'-nucleotidase [Candidatus Izimaplasma bacterium]